MTHNLLAYLDENWQRAVENVRQAAARLWERPAHRHAVDHGPAHADRVVVLLGGLTEGLMTQSNQPLATEEIYVLLAAAHLHAIGLQDEQSEPDPDARWTRYPELGAEMIYRAVEMPEEVAHLGLTDDPGLLEMIALVVARHQEIEYPSPDYDDFPLGGATVRPRLLTALLCLADGLDLDYRRVDLAQLRLMDLAPEVALDWWLHHFVSGVQVLDEYVRVGYRVPQGDTAYGDLLPNLVERGVRADFEALRDTLRLYGVRVDIAPPTAVRPMRAVKVMPDKVWTVAKRRLTQLQSVVPTQFIPYSPLVEMARGVMAIMGYDCDPPTRVDSPLVCFLCYPREEGLRSPLVVGCKEGPVEAVDVRAVSARLGIDDWQGYVVTETLVLPSAREEAQLSHRVQVLSLVQFHRELLKQWLDFSDYVEALVNDYEESELAHYCIPLGCVHYRYDDQGDLIAADRYKPMDEYLGAWLTERGSTRERNHISLLGDYGTGKTSFCRRYAAKQGRRWLANPDRERIPLLVNLRDYAKTLDVQSLITSVLVNQYGIVEASFEAFMNYNMGGRLLIILDGFDEMVVRTGPRTAVENFWELAKVVVPGSKVVLTCRTPYFRTRHEAEALLQGQADETSEDCESLEVSRKKYIDLRGRPNFEIAHLEPFTDEDIQAVLQARFPDRWEVYWNQIQWIYNLLDLARRPVLLDMIARTLPELRDGETISAAQLYQVYTGFWLEREITKGRTLLTPADRRLFAEELAMEMLRTGDLTIHYSRIPAQVQAHFQLEKVEEIDYFDADVRTCNFLNRDDAGNYAFVHKSFMEFFAASQLHRLMLEDQATPNGPIRINEEIRLFLRDLFTLEPKAEPDPPYEPPEGFVWVPPGEFVLGGRDGLPLQVAQLDQGFFASKTPVTNEQYARFVAETGRRPPRHWGRSDPPLGLADHPVVYVSWQDAMAYAEWAGARLPTEQEWEKAARGYDGREYPWGEWVDERCNLGSNTLPVGQFSPVGDTIYGLQDAAGQVWEWTASEVGADGSLRVLRGGSFKLSAIFSRCAVRREGAPTHRWINYGFRVVISSVSPTLAQ
jgi:hypothetical protein